MSQIDAHTLHALDALSGKSLWTFTAGGRVDSPPTFWEGRLLFGCKDGSVYCLRASDGALIWRFQAAPGDRQHVAFEQIESVWPVHGSVLVTDGIVNLVAGRSIFLDGGLRFIRLDARTGKKLIEEVYDDRDPENGKDIQERLQVLQMPVGLNDVLSTDNKHIYLRSQKIVPETGKRIDIGPVSGDFAKQGGAQHGEGEHLFAPMGFLDDSWFHRSYWVFGKNFAGGHGGYYQAGKYAPSGRILVFNDEKVYGFGREAQYYKWTTTMEHQLFSASREAPQVPVGGGGGGGKKPLTAPAFPSVSFPKDAKLDPSGRALTVEAWVRPDGPTGVIVHHGGSLNGYALVLQDGRPGFAIRRNKEEIVVQAARELDPGWHHLAGVLDDAFRLTLYVDGERAAGKKGSGFIPADPNLGLLLGSANTSLVTELGHGAPYTGLLDQFALHHRALTEQEILDRANETTPGNVSSEKQILFCSFDNGNARDESGNDLGGVLSGVETGKGKVGAALWFQKTGKKASPLAGKGAAQNKGSFVQHQWANKLPIMTRAMAMAGNTIFNAGPPDVLDEEYAFERLTQKDPAIFAELAEQDAALKGERGGGLWSVDSESGRMQNELKLDSPPVWDGMAIARGRLYIATVNGKVTCFGAPKN